MLNLEDITLKKTNIKIHYEDFINPEYKHTILILHGWGGSSQSWLKVGQLLFNNGYNVIIPDLPGFGKTKLDKVFDLEEYAIVIEEFIKELSLNNVILWGHSNGGAISIKIANRGKIVIDRLILNNSAGIRNDRKRNFKRKALYSIAKFLKIFKSIPGFNKIRTILYKLVGSHDYINAENNHNLKQTYINMINSDLKSEIDNIKNHTLLIRGESDTYTPKSDGVYMRNHIKNSKIIVLENEKHGIHLTSPNKLVSTFLNNI